MVGVFERVRYSQVHVVFPVYTHPPSNGASPEIVLFLPVDFLPLGSHIISRLKGMLYIFPPQENYENNELRLRAWTVLRYTKFKFSAHT